MPSNRDDLFKTFLQRDKKLQTAKELDNMLTSATTNQNDRFQLENEFETFLEKNLSFDENDQAKESQRQSSQDWLISVIKPLNDKVDDEGVCSGFTDLCVYQGLHVSLDGIIRLMNIIYLFQKYDFLLNKLIDKTKHNKLADEKVSAKKLTSFETIIAAICEFIQIHQLPHIYSDFFNGALVSQRDVLVSAARMFHPKKAVYVADEKNNIQRDNIIKRAVDLEFTYKADEKKYAQFTNNVKYLEFILNKIAALALDKLSLFFYVSLNQHAIFVHYNAKNKKWLIININTAAKKGFVFDYMDAGAAAVEALAHSPQQPPQLPDIIRFQLYSLPSNQEVMNQFLVDCLSLPFFLDFTKPNVNNAYKTLSQLPENIRLPIVFAHKDCLYSSDFEVVIQIFKLLPLEDGLKYIASFKDCIYNSDVQPFFAAIQIFKLLPLQDGLKYIASLDLKKVTRGNACNFVDILKAIPIELRLKFLVNNVSQDAISNDSWPGELIVEFVRLLSPEDGVKYIASLDIKKVVKDNSNLAKLLVCIPSELRVKFATDHLFNDAHGLVKILEEISSEARLNFLNANIQLVNYYNLPDVLQLLPQKCRLNFALRFPIIIFAQKNPDASTFFLRGSVGSVTEAIPENERMAFLLNNKREILDLLSSEPNKIWWKPWLPEMEVMHFLRPVMMDFTSISAFFMFIGNINNAYIVSPAGDWLRKKIISLDNKHELFFQLLLDINKLIIKYAGRDNKIEAADQSITKIKTALNDALSEYKNQLNDEKGTNLDNIAAKLISALALESKQSSSGVLTSKQFKRTPSPYSYFQPSLLSKDLDSIIKEYPQYVKMSIGPVVTSVGHSKR